MSELKSTTAELNYFFFLMSPQECIKPVKVEQKSGRGVIRIDDGGGAEAIAVQVTGTPALALYYLISHYHIGCRTVTHSLPLFC